VGSEQWVADPECPVRAFGIPPPRVSSKGIGGCHTPAFCGKRLQAVENKGREVRKWNKEAASD
jgi:hypothetical protein